MVTNLPPEAKARFAKYMEARTPEDKLRALEEFLSAVPKHKGTENLVRWIRKRMAELRDEIEERKRKKTGGGPSFFVEKEGAAQVVMIGYTKVGKSALLSSLTGAKVQSSDTPYATKVPAVGMLPYKDIQFQLVEAPSIIPNGGGWNSKVIGLVKNSDAALIVLDASKCPSCDLESLIDFLEENGLTLRELSGRVEVERLPAGSGLKIVSFGKLRCAEEEVRGLLLGYGIKNALVKVYGDVDLGDIEKALFERVTFKPSLVLLNKVDLIKDVEGTVAELRKTMAKRGLLPAVPVVPVSALGHLNLDAIAPLIFKVLDIIRVYTKPPNGEVSSKPLVLKRGATVLDVAKAVHEDFVKRFAYARLWGPSAKYPGQRVGLDHRLSDGDVVEINLRR